MAEIDEANPSLEVGPDFEGSELDPLSDPDERRVLFAALDSFR